MCQGKLKKACIKPGCRRRFSRPLRVVMLALFLVSTTWTAGAREKLATIVIDPGHGGRDHGIAGPTRLVEKDITLAVANLIVKERKGTYRVVLTRTGDYGLSLFERTAVANHQRADLFISIHAGGSMSKQKTGCTLYYYKQASPEDVRTPSHLPDPESLQDTPTPWSNCQTVHVSKSRAAAEAIASRFSKPFISTGFPLKTTIKGYPSAVLSGADMPALLAEIGYITSPGEVKSLSTNEYLSELAHRICQGIDDFFSKKNNAVE